MEVKQKIGFALIIFCLVVMALLVIGFTIILAYYSSWWVTAGFWVFVSMLILGIKLLT